MDHCAIRVQNVSKTYKLYEKNIDRIKDVLNIGKNNYSTHYALSDVSFEIKRGETVGIIGTNGAGKSTILKIITGVLTQTEGEVEINGRISALLELGAGFNPEYSGIENIYLNGTMMGFSKEEINKRMDDILAFADIGEFVKQPVKTYSSGMFVRLAFAVAINIDPDILIVDEALSVGDVFFQTKCYQKFEDFKRRGKTILFVSHDLGSISRYCDRVIFLNKGKKEAEGSTKDVINLYKKALTSSLGSKLKKDNLVRRDNTKVEAFWKNYFTINPDLDEYGDGKATIYDFAVIDEDGEYTNIIPKNTRFKICVKALINEPIYNPIFTFTFKSIRGVDITGTNTMLEKVDLGDCRPGDEFLVTFEQDMNLQGGDYLLSMSCTGYENGALVAHHRMYDVLSITVVSNKNTVGFYDMNSETTVERIDAQAPKVD